MRIKELRYQLINKLSALDNPPLEARVLLSYFLNLDQAKLIIYSDKEIEEEKVEEILEASERRLSGVPSAYITSSKEFYGLTFRVNESVLIPQPDTEVLVEEAISLIRSNKYNTALDICTGSGCIITSIKHECPDINAYFSDISSDALSVAKLNYERLIGEEGNSKLSDLFNAWRGSKFDIITANAPYVTRKWYSEVSDEVKHEPLLALIDEDEDGLGIIRKIIKEAKNYLNNGGSLLLEADYRQHEAIREELKKNGYSEIRTIKDLAGRERVSIALNLA